MSKEIQNARDHEKQLTTTPAQLLEIAVNKDADIDKLQKLMELQIRWEDRQAERAYNEATASFRVECPTIKKTLSGHNSKYAGLSETIDQIKPLLKTHGLSYTWKTEQDGDKTSVTCKVTHAMGHSEETTLSASPDTSGSKNAIQAIGSTVSYLQRYTLYAVLGLTSAEMDNDGQTEEKDVTAEEIDKLENMLMEADADIHKFLEYVKADSLGEMNRSQYEKGLKGLKTRKKGAK